MFKQITSEKKRFLTNSFFLSILQAANYFFPLLTFPYLVRVLGPEYFGLLAFATATTQYFVLLTDYGFDLSATRQISIHRNSKDKINEIFSSVMMIKSILLAVSFGLMFLLIQSFERFSSEKALFFITFLTVFGHVLFPVWVFQGLEDMRYVTYINVGSKFFFVCAVFVFVNEQSDYLLVPLLTVIGSFVSSVWSLMVVKNRFSVGFSWQSLETLRFYARDGWYLFFSSLSVSLYTTSIAFILGLLSGFTAVGVYSSVEKIVQAAKGLYIPFSRALYPLASKKINDDKESGIKFVFSVGKFLVPGILALSLMLFVFAETVTSILLGVQYDGAAGLLKIMAFLPFILVVGDMLSVQLMFNLGYQKEFTQILFVAAVLGAVFATIMISLYSNTGAAVAVLSVEMVITMSLGIFLYMKRRKGIL